MDHAIWRIKVIPFEVTIPDAEQDKRLPEALAKELGVLRDERGAVWSGHLLRKTTWLCSLRT